MDMSFKPDAQTKSSVWPCPTDRGERGERARSRLTAKSSQQ